MPETLQKNLDDCYCASHWNRYGITIAVIVRHPARWVDLVDTGCRK